MPPIIAVLFVNNRGIVGFQIVDEVFFRLVFEFEAINEKKDPPCISRPEKKFDDCGGNERFAGAGCHFK